MNLINRHVTFSQLSNDEMARKTSLRQQFSQFLFKSSLYIRLIDDTGIWHIVEFLRRITPTYDVELNMINKVLIPI